MLHQAAVEAGCKIRLGSKVIAIDDEAPSVELQNGDVVSGDLIMLTDGAYYRGVHESC